MHLTPRPPAAVHRPKNVNCISLVGPADVFQAWKCAGAQVGASSMPTSMRSRSDRYVSSTSSADAASCATSASGDSFASTACCRASFSSNASFDSANSEDLQYTWQFWRHNRSKTNSAKLHEGQAPDDGDLVAQFSDLALSRQVGGRKVGVAAAQLPPHRAAG